MRSPDTDADTAANPPAPPATVELAEEVSHLMMQAVHQSRIELDAALAERGISQQQLVLLRRLFEDGPMPMRAISDLLSIEPSTVTSMVDKLEGRGLIERTSDDRDRRVKLVALTPRGQALVADLWSRMARLTPVGRLDTTQLRSLRALLITMVGPLPPNAPWVV